MERADRSWLWLGLIQKVRECAFKPIFTFASLKPLNKWLMYHFSKDLVCKNIQTRQSDSFSNFYKVNIGMCKGVSE